MKKSTIPGTKIIKVVAGKNGSEEKLRKDLEKIGKIELLGKALKSVFSLWVVPTLPDNRIYELLNVWLQLDIRCNGGGTV